MLFRSCKNRAHLAHRNICHQGLEVLAGSHLGPRLSQVPVQRADPRLAPAQFHRLRSESILTFRADGLYAIRKVNAVTGAITTYAGSTSFEYGYSGDGGLATSALLYAPSSLAF